jgi:hypothetical protein
MQDKRRRSCNRICDPKYTSSTSKSILYLSTTYSMRKQGDANLKIVVHKSKGEDHQMGGSKHEDESVQYQVCLPSSRTVKLTAYGILHSPSCSSISIISNNCANIHIPSIEFLFPGQIPGRLPTHLTRDQHPCQRCPSRSLAPVTCPRSIVGDWRCIDLDFFLQGLGMRVWFNVGHGCEGKTALAINRVVGRIERYRRTGSARRDCARLGSLKRIG